MKSALSSVLGGVSSIHRWQKSVGCKSEILPFQFLPAAHCPNSNSLPGRLSGKSRHATTSRVSSCPALCFCDVIPCPSPIRWQRSLTASRKLDDRPCSLGAANRTASPWRKFLAANDDRCSNILAGNALAPFLFSHLKTDKKRQKM